jgi:Skp family chaperone for outer membrane proteins
MRFGVAIAAAVISMSCLWAAPVPQAQQSQPGQTGGTKIAFINTTQVLQGTAEGRKELSELQAYEEALVKKLQAEQSKLDELQKQYASQSRMLNPDTAAEMQQSIQDQSRSVKRLQEDNQMDISQRRTDLLNKMSQKIQAVIADYAQKNSVGAVFLDSPTMPYFSQGLDITTEIISLYDQTHPVAGGQATTSGAASPAPANPPQQ